MLIDNLEHKTDGIQNDLNTLEDNICDVDARTTSVESSILSIRPIHQESSLTRSVTTSLNPSSSSLLTPPSTAKKKSSKF